MADLALVLYALYGAVAFGYRSWLQRRRTGTTGFKGLGGRPFSAERFAGVGFALAIVTGVAAPVLDLAGVVEPIAALDEHIVHAIGAALALFGIAATLLAQLAMGDSWRIGVDHTERTTLVTGGPFRLVRNPIFSAMIPTALGIALVLPSVVAFAGLVALAVALELQVRVVEEPYLRDVHGEAYEHYAARTGRFVPGLGHITAAEPTR